VNPFLLALRAREKLFDAGFFKTRRLAHPVISIGNLTVGGTGKTPLTITLAEEVRKRGFRPVVLSRGYRRTSRGALIVSRGSGPLVPWEKAGDEPFLMAKRLVGIAAIVVGQSRYQAGRIAEQENLGDLFILDDGFQHRQLHRDFDLLTIDPQEWLESETLLPVGPWREPKSAIARADAACVQGGPSLTLPIPAFNVRLDVDGLPLGALNGRAITAFAGIAKPQRFFSTLESLGLHLVRRISFPDHHNFTDDDLRELNGSTLVTTEKDAVKLEGRAAFFTLRVSAKIADVEGLMNLILQRLSHV